MHYKRTIFQLLDEHSRPDVVIASSSSGLPSSAFVDDCKYPERVLIGHPFNPPHLIPLVEVVPHPGTSEGTINLAVELYRELGKKPVVIREEAPGFVGNRLQAALVQEAYSLVRRGVVSAKDVGELHSRWNSPLAGLTGDLLPSRCDCKQWNSLAVGASGSFLNQVSLGGTPRQYRI